MAACYGLEVAKRMGFNKVHMEGDALNAISAISNKETGRAPIHLVYDNRYENVNFLLLLRLALW